MWTPSAQHMPALTPPVIPPLLRRQTWPGDVPDAVPTPAGPWADNGLQPPQISPWGDSEPPQSSPWGDFGDPVGSLKLANSVGASPWAASQSVLWPASSTQESQEPLLLPGPSSQHEHQPPDSPGIESVGRGILCAARACCLPSGCLHAQVCGAGDMLLLLPEAACSRSLSQHYSVPAFACCPQCPAIASLLCVCMLSESDSALAAAAGGCHSYTAIMLHTVTSSAPCHAQSLWLSQHALLQECPPARPHALVLAAV